MATQISRIWGSISLWWRSLSPLATDAWFYGLSALFAWIIALGSWQPAQWHWGYLSIAPFAAAAFLVLAGPRSSADRMRRWRLGVLSLTFVGVVAVPLVVEIVWRHQFQPEVQTIQNAGQAIAAGHSPYPDHLVPGLPKFESFFPYFPFMSIFGLPSAATHELHGFSDARIAMTLFTVLMLIIALAMLRAPPDRKIRVAQILVVLPTGSLFLATGGDDMPILALCLLSLVALQRNRAVATGLILGVACGMKLTAWPFALAILAISYGRSGKRALQKTLVAMSCVLAVAIIPFFLVNPRAFFSNVVSFPLGLAGVQSPAASPLPGHMLITAFPMLRHVVLPLVFLVGGMILWRFVRRRWPLDLPTALRILAVATAVLICSATATRFGYLIYPLNFMLWSWVLTPEPAISTDGSQLVQVHAPRRATP